MNKSTFPVDGGFDHKERVKRPLIMIVEEHPESRELLRYVLEQEGYKVLLMQTGEQALRWLEFTSPNLILMDIQYSATDLSCLQQIHERVRSKEVPILLTTGDARPILQEQLQAEGYSELFIKPLEIEELTQALGQHFSC